MTTKNEDIEQEARKLFDQLIEEIPRKQLWPVIVGLLQQVLLSDEATVKDYHYGVFALTDTLCDAAESQSGKDEDVETDIAVLSRLRKYHLKLC